MPNKQKEPINTKILKKNYKCNAEIWYSKTCRLRSAPDDERVIRSKHVEQEKTVE